MKKALAVCIALLLLAAAVPPASAGNISSVTIAVPKVDNVQITLTEVYEKYAEGDFGFGYGYTFYLQEGGTATFPYDLTLTKFATGEAVEVKAGVPVAAADIAGAGMYSSDRSAYFVIDTTSSPYFSEEIANKSLSDLQAAGEAAPAPPPQASASAAGAPAPVAPGEEITVYVTVSVDGVLKIAAQPVTVNVATVEAALKAAHAAYCPEGEAGFHAGVNQQFFMYMIDKFWNVSATPYVIVNGTPLGADMSKPATADTAPIAEGDNIIVNVTSPVPGAAPGAPSSIPVVALTVDKEGVVKATVWSLDFTTFKYNSAPYGNAEIVDAETGKVLGKTDGMGRAKISTPDCGVAAIAGLAAVPVGEVRVFTPISDKYVPPVRDYSVFGGPDGRSLLIIVVVGLSLALPLGIVVLYAQRREIKNRGVKFSKTRDDRIKL